MAMRLAVWPAAGRAAVAWGYNGGGQPADGTTTDRLTPVPEPAGVLAAGGLVLAAVRRWRRG